MYHLIGSIPNKIISVLINQSLCSKRQTESIPYVLVDGPEHPVHGLLGDDDAPPLQPHPAARAHTEEHGVVGAGVGEELDHLCAWSKLNYHIILSLYYHYTILSFSMYTCRNTS